MMVSSGLEEQLGFNFTFPVVRPTLLLSVDELYDGMSTEMAVEAKEDHRVERKSASYKPRPLGDYFSMWANTSPDGGVILIGVDDDGRISGCAATDTTHINDLQRAGDVFCPDARYQYKTVDVINSEGKPDFIVAIRVRYREDRVVETTAGKAFTRRGSTKKELIDAEKRELQISKGQLEIESEPSTLAYPLDFNWPLLTQFVENVREQRGLPFTHSVEDILKLRRLGRIKPNGFVPNLACALLFARDPQQIVPGCKIRFLRFEGTVEKTGKEYNATKSFWIEGPVPELIQQAEKIVESQLREFMRLGENGKFISTPEYPKDAWYEAIVNACVHRSYNLRNMHVVIKMFDDRLEVESPGGFLPLVTPENIYEMHVPRNPHLMDAMFYLKFVLCAHEGTRRIKESMQRLGLPAPVFQETASTAALVKVTLRNDVEHRREFVDSDAYKVLGEALSNSLDENERRMVNHIAEHGTINVTEAGRLCGIRWQRAKKILKKLAERNILDHVHSDTVERDAHAYFTLKKRYTDKLRSSSSFASRG
jgi:ATP-dependent DNA helicase RecG